MQIPEALDILEQADSLLADETHPIVQAANLSALIMDALEDINWAGFYFLHKGTLLLGPFQGKPACIRIPIGRGVCGSAAASRRTQCVPDVHAFPGHIACDARSRSELVIPLLQDGRLLGVLDLDSPSLNRFGEKEIALLEAVAARYAARCDFAGTAYDLQEP
ncbi:MAG TPA: GAF domain-containing protein [Clostridia bacterium]|nr:GAF domain-containing protein [Clostridia bacterium]